MLVEEVERLINEGKIVACNLSDLRAVNIEKEKDTKKYKFYAEKIEIEKLNKHITFLYKIDDVHYLEFYSKIVVTVIDYYAYYLDTKGNETFLEFAEEYENNYKANPFVILKKDLLKVGAKEKEAFRNNKISSIDFSACLEQKMEKSKTRLQEQYKIALLAHQKKLYAEKVFNELTGKKVYLVRISDLQTAVLHIKDYDGEFRYRFGIENRTNFQTLETTNFTLIIQDEFELFKEYYSGKQVLIGNNPEIKKLLEPLDFNEFENNYGIFLANPLIAARETQEYNDDTKYLIGENIGKEIDIKERIGEISKRAISNLENEYTKIERTDEIDSYVDNALVDIALRLRNENTED